MSVEAIALLALRAMGALWVVGAIFLLRQLWFNSKLDPMIAALDKIADEFRAETGEGPAKPKIDMDNNRERWLAAGAVITGACGVVMALAMQIALALQAIAIVHQLLYFYRQRQRELKAGDAATALLERPSAEAVNGFYATIILTMLTAWLYYRGALS
jgi:hypothetical protein